MEETMPEETENLEKEIEVPTEEETEEVEVETQQASEEHEEEIEKYSEKVQKRIDKLTYNQREAERQRDEALRVAQNLQEKVKEFEEKVQDKDEALITEYGGRVETQLQQANDKYRTALENGDIDTQVATQQEIAKLAVEQETINRRRKQKSVEPKNGAANTPPPIDPRATAWAQKEENSWFGRDRVMTSAAFEIDKEMQEQGINPTAPDYYDQLDERIKEAFPHKFEQGETKAPPVQAVGRTSAGANPTTRKSKKVKLTSSQQAIAKKLGVPLEEYAKYV
tara:strand:- start:5581 stop:6423 length:843 start_codon:yes stop_codon:yes gene_type:complete